MVSNPPVVPFVAPRPWWRVVRSRGVFPVFAMAFLAALALPSAAAASDEGGVHVRIEDPSGGGLRLELDGNGWIAGVVRAALAEVEADCQGDLDRDTRRLLRELDREGEGARAELVEGDKWVQASRRAGQLVLLVEEHGETARISVPWAFAACALGGRVDLGAAMAAGGGLDIDIEGDDGSRVVVRID
jgi:hypothetical protein